MITPSIFHNQTLSTGDSWGCSLISSFDLPAIHNWQCWCSLIICFKRMCLMNTFFFEKKPTCKFCLKLQSNLRIFTGEKPKPTHPRPKWNFWEQIPSHRFGPVFLKLDRFYQYHVIALMASYNTCYNKA